MAKKKKKQETGGLQAPKMTVVERETLNEEKRKVKEKKEKKKKKEKVRRDRRSIVQVFRDMIGELKKVRWPNFATVVAKTGVVLGVVVIFSLIVFGIDYGLGELYRLLTRGL